MGGGYAMLPLLQKEFVDKLGWLSEEDFIDMLALVQSVPGAMVVNLAIGLGHTLFGFRGALVALAGATMSSLVMLTVIGLFFYEVKDKLSAVEHAFRGINPAVTGMVLASAVGMMARVNKSAISGAIFIITVLVVAYFKLSPIYIIIGAAAAGVLLTRVKEGGHA